MSSGALRDKDIEARLPKIVSEFGRIGVTRRLLWEEYKQDFPKGFSYCRFCKKIEHYRARKDVTIRLEHRAAHTLSTDFTGKKVSWMDRKTGEINMAEVLVCTLPYSGYTFARALAFQKQEDFIDGINQAVLYKGGLLKVLQNDNLNSFVTKADRYEPTFNQLCIQLASYYGLELHAARVGKPKCKASVERHTGIIYNKVDAPLRDTTFYSLTQINDAFVKHLDSLNKIQLQGKDYSSHDVFVKDKQPHMTSLPSALFEIRKSTKAKIQRNYYVILSEDWHQYINSIILSVILASLYTKLDHDSHLIWAIKPMILTNIISMAFAIYTTQPKMGRGSFSVTNVNTKTVRLMTFNDFYQKLEKEYEEAVEKIVTDREFLYATKKKDIHQLGAALSKRYKNIRISYDVFFVVLIISIFIFGACHLFF